MTSPFRRQCAREIRLYLRQPKWALYACLFFCMIVMFFPLTLPPDMGLLRILAPGLIWVAVLLSMLLSAERLFQQDSDDGLIEQWLVSGLPVHVLVMAKLLIHWGLSVAPMLIFCPILALLMHLSAYEVMIVAATLICGTPAMLLLCAFSAALSTSLKQKSVIMALVLLPLTIPVMIFGSATCTAALNQLPVSGYLALLLALSLLAMMGLPFAIATVLRILD